MGFVKLYDRNIVLVWLRRLCNRYLAKSRRNCDIRNGIINCFLCFFLLSFTKLLRQSLLLVQSPVIYSLHDKVIIKEHVNNYDPTSKEKATTPVNLIAATIIIIITVFNITPVVVLILYSFRCFKACLFKCRLDSLALTAFVEKFYCCYRDGLEGGKDTRSLSSLYFVLIYLIPLYHYLHIFKLQISFWSYLGFLFMVAAFLVGYLKPYKKSYMNILDTILLAYMSVFFTLLTRSFFFF